MKRPPIGIALAILFLIVTVDPLRAQTVPKIAYFFGKEPMPGLASNSVTDIVIYDGTIWLGTGGGLSRSTDGGLTWESFGQEHGLGKGGVSALAVRDDIIWVATSFDTLTADAGKLPAGGGLSYSTDGGTTWNWLPQPGPTNVQNVTFDIALLDDTVWITSWGGGLRKSDNLGITWEVVTPDTFFFDPLGNLNHRAFSVIVVDTVLWVGTAGGINKSMDRGDTWVNFSHQNQPQPISGNFVVALAHQRTGGRDILWAATINAEDPDEFRAVSKSIDGGLSWTTTLEGIFAHNFAFDDSVVYVVADKGLFKSIDGGQTWAVFPPVRDRTTGEAFYTEEFFSVGVAANHAVWAGGPDGLAVTEDDGLNWRIIRAAQPVGVEGTPQTYAYPNPFSPLRHLQAGGDGHVRFQYRTNSSTQVTVRVYDFAMKLVATVTENKPIPAPGDHSEVWNGRNEKGEVVANGVYFYRIDVQGEGSYWGKVIVLD